MLNVHKGSRYLFIRATNKIISKLNYPTCFHIKLEDFIHKIIFNKLRIYFDKALNNANNYNITNHKNSNIIWVFWWQGYNNAPLIIRRCIDSIRKNSNGHRVIVITKKNIVKYSSIEPYIYKKMSKGLISLAHFSDVLRFNLLNKYGGLWIDSTIYCTNKISNKYFGTFYTSGPGGINVNRNHNFVSDKWTSFLIGGCCHNIIFIFMNEFYKLYWKDNNQIINYFMMDYALKYVYRYNIGNFKYYTDNIAYKNNPHLHSLLPCINKVFNYDYFQYITRDTNLFKLTYKIKIDKIQDSYYNKLIK